MKKKTIIILGAVAVIAVGGIVTVNALNKNAQQVAVKQAPKDDWELTILMFLTCNKFILTVSSNRNKWKPLRAIKNNKGSRD